MVSNDDNWGSNGVDDDNDWGPFKDDLGNAYQISREDFTDLNGNDLYDSDVGKVMLIYLGPLYYWILDLTGSRQTMQTKMVTMMTRVI